MTRVRTFRRNAITRADAIVTTVAIGLLVPLVVAALHDTGEQTRIAQCLSNLGHIGRATQLYLADYQDNLPVWVNETSAGAALPEWSYGGKTNDDFWKQAPAGYSCFWVPAVARPLNEYVLGRQPQPDVVEGTQIVRRTPMPMFACPSDHGSYQRCWYERQWSPLAAYDDVGTSYLCNVFAAMDTCVEYTEDLWENHGAGFARLLRRLVLDGRAGRADELLLYPEEPLSFAVVWGNNGPVQAMGNHGRWSWHAAGYLDGHADYQFMDTRSYCGPGWAAINPNWVPQIGQPKPPVYYINWTENCEPPD